MKHRIAITFLALALALITTMGTTQTVYAPPPCGGGTPSYSLTISPSAPLSLGSSATMTLSESGGARNSVYTISFQVLKPNGTGSAVASKALATNNQCNGSIVLAYPDPSFTASSGTVATDVGGVYSVFVNQTAPTNTGTVATGQFTVSSQLTVVTSQPSAGSTVQRGQTITISGTVSSPSGPDGTATVFAHTPNGDTVYLLQTSLGVYSVSYQVTSSDPIGAWTIVLVASDSQGNSGTGQQVVVIISRSDLVVDSLATYNQRDVPTTSFSPGDTVYAFFRIRYSSNTYLTSGQYPVGLRDSSGKWIANLTASYDSSRFGFYTATGYPVTATIPGTWTMIIGANTIDDGYGNTGPGLDTSVPLQIVVVTSPLSYWPFVLAGIIAVVGTVATAKRLDITLEGFQHLEELMGGPLPRGASILLSGDAGSGKTILSYQILHDELESGKLCALLSYDAFPEDVQARMNEFGWDIVSPLRKGRLKIIDCYSSLAGHGEGAIKDPSDLTELNIQITAFIGKAKGGPVTVVLDSLTPIFNGVEERQGVNFIQTIGAKVKKTGGLFIQTASRGAISDDAAAKLKTMADGVIELNVVRSHGKIHRFLSVVKMERRRIASASIPFEIDRNRGFVFRVSRIALLRNKIMAFIKVHHLFKNGKTSTRKLEVPVIKSSTSRQSQSAASEKSN